MVVEVDVLTLTGSEKEPVVFLGEWAALIHSELPPGIPLDATFLEIKLRYWTWFLHRNPVPMIPEDQLLVEYLWPFPFRVLIAKLIVYEAMLRTLKSLLSSDSEGNSSGILKKVETGPSSVEWYDGSRVISQLFRSAPGSKSSFETLSMDICMNAGRLNVYLPICADIKKPIVFQKTIHRKPGPSSTLPHYG